MNHLKIYLKDWKIIKRMNIFLSEYSSKKISLIQTIFQCYFMKAFTVHHL